MEEDFIEENADEGGSSRRPFLVAVGVLLTIFVLAAACSSVMLLTRGDDQPEVDPEAVAAIYTRNAETAATNTAVAMTIAAMETEAARPTDTPEPPTATNTATPPPTETTAPTNTPVIAKETEKATSETLETIIAEATTENTPTPIAVSENNTGSSDNGGSTSGNTGGVNNGEGSLPQTGIDTWGAVVVAALLIVVLFAARRLRSG